MSEIKSGKMKAIQWEGKSFSVSVNEVDIPKIRRPTDAIVRLTSSAICGTDLHTYHGRILAHAPLTFGHENIGIIEEVGSAITTLKKGDRVVVTDLIDKEAANNNGELELVGVFGTGDYGLPIDHINGGLANFMRVPFAHENLLVIPSGTQHELDYLLLADIWPTAWFGLESAHQVPGDTVVIFGAGPVGLLAAYSAKLRGAIRVYSVDSVPLRLEKAKSIGAIPINFKEVDPVKEIMKLEPNGVDRAVDCVGFECVDAQGKNDESIVITQAIQVTRTGGGIGLVGVWALHDAELLKTLIERADAKPSFVFTKEFSIEEGAKAFREFSDHEIVKGVIRF
ncbi:putative S-glutathione dehydrogenase [Xylogone sp. PMI_703]|nr:putative S-glutathione dehydrogenase [Xylogone sp. PMI_703]